MPEKHLKSSSLYKGKSDKFTLYPLNNDCPALTSGSVVPVSAPDLLLLYPLQEKSMHLMGSILS